MDAGSAGRRDARGDRRRRDRQRGACGDLSIAEEGQLELSLVGKVRADVAPGSLIRNVDCQALAAQMAAPAAGSRIVETIVGSPGSQLYLPLTLRTAG